jgi:hypothetical protein
MPQVPLLIWVMRSIGDRLTLLLISVASLVFDMPPLRQVIQDCIYDSLSWQFLVIRFLAVSSPTRAREGDWGASSHVPSAAVLSSFRRYLTYKSLRFSFSIGEATSELYVGRLFVSWVCPSYQYIYCPCNWKIYSKCICSRIQNRCWTSCGSLDTRGRVCVLFHGQLCACLLRIIYGGTSLETLVCFLSRTWLLIRTTESLLFLSSIALVHSVGFIHIRSISRAKNYTGFLAGPTVQARGALNAGLRMCSFVLRGDI